MSKSGRRRKWSRSMQGPDEEQEQEQEEEKKDEDEDEDDDEGMEEQDDSWRRRGSKSMRGKRKTTTKQETSLRSI